MSKNTRCPNATEHCGLVSGEQKSPWQWISGKHFNFSSLSFFVLFCFVSFFSGPPRKQMTPKCWKVFSPTQARENREQCALIQDSQRNTEDRPAVPNETQGLQVLSDLNCLLGPSHGDGLTLIKAAICWLWPRQAESRGAADATNYQLFWKWNLSGVECESVSASCFVCPGSESASLALIRLITVDARERHLPWYFL